MSQENVESQRTIEERVGIRWPSLARRTMRSVLGLPPGSRVRKVMLERLARTAFLEWNRGDCKVIPEIFDDPQVETHIVGAPIDADPVYYGPEGHIRAMEVWNDAWREWDGEIDEVIEEGHDRVLIVARVWGEGAASGIKLDAWGAVRYTVRDGRIVRVDGAFGPDRDRALDALGSLEAAGLSE
jgi:ketosteroid isomerase-like protein